MEIWNSFHISNKIHFDNPEDTLENLNHTTITYESLPLLLSAKDVNKIGISRSAFYRLIHRDDVPTLSIEGRIFIPRDRFIAWIENNTEIN